jgi:serine/threonine protein kinase
MSPADDFASVDSLLDAALDRPPEGRDDFLREACAADQALFHQVRRLIQLAHDDAAEALEAGGGLQGAIWDDIAREMDKADVTLEPGDQVGRFEIRGLIGSGGMGRVYRAFDPTLSREVAVKGLASAFAGDSPQARRRFEREARLLAGLQHPNIAAIFGFEVCEQSPYLILELVEGPTLADRLRRRRLPLVDVVAIARQIALALEEAHGRGVVHRDLKPENVKVGPMSAIKVLDFGIARPVPTAPRSGAEIPALDATTGIGDILGTPPYMSPEQIRGEPADTRTDIWAFGCLLFEMLTGRPAFEGRTRAETFALVLRGDVKWELLPPVAPALRRLLARCLRRDLRQRLQHIGDARIELEELASEETPAAPAPGGHARWLRRAGMLVAAPALAALFLLAGGRSEPGDVSVAQLNLELPADLSLARDFAAPFAVAPDGASLVALAVQSGKQSLFLRHLDKLSLTPIPQTEGAWQPFFSPDGREVAFFADRRLMRVSLGGGVPLPVAEVGGNPRGGCWVDERTMIVAPSPGSGLLRLDVGSGSLHPLTQLDRARGESSHRWPHALPGGAWILFTANVGHNIFDEARLEAVSLATGERRVLVSDASYGRHGGGRLFFVRAGRMFGVPFDPATLELRGVPEVVLDGVRHDPRSGSADFALSDQGVLVYNPANPPSRDRYLAWADETGRVTRIGDGARPFFEPRLSPDGRRVAARVGARAEEAELWIVDTDSATLSRPAFGQRTARPVWTADSQQVTVTVEDGGGWKLVSVPDAGPAPPTTVFRSPNRVFANAWSADGRFLVIQELRPGTGWDLRLLEFGPDGNPTRPPRDIAAEPFDERNASLSPDGRWVAYEADEPDGVTDVYVASLANPSVRVRATTAARSRWPRWGAGGQLYYWNPVGRPYSVAKLARDGLQRIDWSAAASGLDSHVLAKHHASVWRLSPALPAFLERLAVTPYASYDVDLSRVRPRFLILQSSDPTPPPAASPIVVLNWFEKLRARDQPQP